MLCLEWQSICRASFTSWWTMNMHSRCGRLTIRKAGRQKDRKTKGHKDRGKRYIYVGWPPTYSASLTFWWTVNITQGDASERRNDKRTKGKDTACGAAANV